MHMSNKSLLLVSALTRFAHLARAREAKPSDGPDRPRFGWRRRFRFDEMTAAMAAATSELGVRLRQRADRSSTAMAR